MAEDKFADVLVIGGPSRTGMGKANFFQYVKPCILTQSARMAVIDPKADILSTFDQVKILISYEDRDGYECDMLTLLYCTKNEVNNDTVIDEAVYKWMKRHMPKIHQYAWQRASECGMENYPTDVFLNE
jgi:hypothetical protein